MKKALIVANLFHASPRIPGVASFLGEFGWEITLLTPPIGSNAENNLGFPKKFLKEVKIAEVPFRGDIFWFWRKIFKALGYNTSDSLVEQLKSRVGATSERSYVNTLMNCYQAIFAYPDTEITWRKPALSAAIKILQKERFDVIISSSPFPTNHMIAAELKRRFSLKWLADFRDPWILNHNYPYGKIRKYFESKLEKEVIKSADAIMAASPAYAKKQKALHNKSVVVVTNGFNPEDIFGPSIPLRNKFTITYTGHIYAGKQDPGKFFAALGNLISKGMIDYNKIDVRFYGPRVGWLSGEIEKRNLGSAVRLCGTISRNKAILKQKESHVVLLFNWEARMEKGVYPGKFFEYLSAQRPVLAAGGFHGDDMEELILKTKAGIYAVTVEEIENAILNFYHNYKNGKGVVYEGDLREINKYSYFEAAKKVANILNQI